ncbi:MAG: S24/S26 family peptidase, partial [Deltaproteobacteria bacterium]|nr:S24/S26 family peptidase [Deltaproteobacteria bacterium]
MTRFFYKGSSMLGTFRPGDLVFAEPRARSDLRPGDIVVYRRTGPGGRDVFVAHRAVKIVGNGLLTRGDNRASGDMEEICLKDLVGVVAEMERNGRKRIVSGGWRGRTRARLLHYRGLAVGMVRTLARAGHARTRRIGPASRVWRPSIRKIVLNTPDGIVVKYVRGRKVVARWWPAT